MNIEKLSDSEIRELRILLSNANHLDKPITLVITIQDAELLMGHVQNPIHTIEPEDIAKMRTTVFEALKEQLQRSV